MQIHPVKASEWVTFSDNNKSILRQCGGLPVNDKYYELWKRFARIVLLYGGRGGGKSDETAARLIDKAKTQPYFKCYFGRKVYDDVRESCFATLIQKIEETGNKRYFHYSTAQTSSMVITCSNGNKFIPFGANDPNQLKSIKDPTHYWYEEFDQFTFEDFKQSFATLRTIRGENQMYATFNAYAVLPQHWIMKVFFPELAQYELNEAKPDLEELDFGEIQKIFVNYTDNHFIDQEAYRKTLRLLSAGNDMIFQGLANGAWGVPENNNPWLYAFDMQKHVFDTVPYYPAFPIYLSFDFNREPLTCIAAQMSPELGLKTSFLHFIKEFSYDVQLKELCARIKSEFPNSILFVTGDATGQRGDIGFDGRNSSYYSMIKSYLGITDKLMNLNTKNLHHNDSRNLCNMIFANYPNVKISKKGCPKLIQDCVMAQLDVDKGEGRLLKDREVYKLDLFDCKRYLIQTYFLSFVNKVWLNGQKTVGFNR